MDDERDGNITDDLLLLAEDLDEATADAATSEFPEDLEIVIFTVDGILTLLDEDLEQEGIGVNDVRTISFFEFC